MKQKYCRIEGRFIKLNNEMIDALKDLGYEFETKDEIIDLIKVGDYVNGLYVHGITEYGLEVYMFGDTKEILKENEIKTIVSKELFSEIQYDIEKGYGVFNE